MSADYIMVGGFLGAGKTTAMLRLAGHLTAQGWWMAPSRTAPASVRRVLTRGTRW